MKGLWLAADVTLDQATKMLDKFGNLFYGAKAHKLIDPAARARIKTLKRHGARKLWADFKGHDTPDTILGRAEALQACGVDFITIHASGGKRMMKQVVATGLEIYAVVQLTSLSDEEFARYYQPNAVKNMIEDAVIAGVRGFICPPTQVKAMRVELARYAGYFDIVVPGTRFVDGEAHDQQQVDTPGATVKNGADYLVVGRMFTAAKDKEKSITRLISEIQQAQQAVKA